MIDPCNPGPSTDPDGPVGYEIRLKGHLDLGWAGWIVDFVGEMVWFVQFFFFPGYEAITYPGFAARFVAEVSLSLWLLIVGVRAQEPAPQNRPLASTAAN